MEFDLIVQFSRITGGFEFGEYLTQNGSIGSKDNPYIRATKVRRVIVQNFAKAFETVDALLLPVSPCVAFGQDEKLDPISMYMCDMFTIPSAIAGLGGISVPVGFDGESGLPIGMQIVPKFKDELTMFKLAKYLEQGYTRGEF